MPGPLPDNRLPFYLDPQVALVAIPDNCINETVITLSGAATLDETYPSVCRIDPGGAGRDVTLEAESAAKEGLLRVIVNMADAAETLTVKDPDGNTIRAVAQNKAGVFRNDGTSGWTWFFDLNVTVT